MVHLGGKQQFELAARERRSRREKFPETLIFFAQFKLLNGNNDLELFFTKLNKFYTVGKVILRTTTICQRKLLIPIIPHRSSERRFRIKV